MSRSTGRLSIIEVRDAIFCIESSPASGDPRRYWVDPNRLRCDCPAGQRRRHCRHLTFVLDHLENG